VNHTLNSIAQKNELSFDALASHRLIYGFFALPKNKVSGNYEV